MTGGFDQRLGSDVGGHLSPDPGWVPSFMGAAWSKCHQAGCMNKCLGCTANSFGQEIVELSGGIG